MAILHELVEFDAGDTNVNHVNENKFDNELIAAKRIFSLLPNKIKDEFLDLWIKFEKKESIEAQYVGSLDRFLPLLSNVLNQGHCWKNHNISSRRVVQINGPAIKAGPEQIWSLTEDLIKKSISERHVKHDNNE